ncbi:hypothetical protein COLO4_32843 [Corchorus olitorius]|uniref:Uncharacterized protein n=1 Tax=Corchorus olitorius TaxID=93759 RepID=A0A1R3GXS9_9ROSI|nr:hypothetical protein COLO4_32843 [Corchorus olitorius]
MIWCLLLLCQERDGFILLEILEGIGLDLFEQTMTYILHPTTADIGPTGLQNT